MNIRRMFAPFAVAAAGLTLGGPAVAAASYDSCTGTIASLPAVISSQGTWCLKADVATAMATGIAITVEANNVTIDCNGFKVGGLSAGLGTWTTGIQSSRLNTVVRNCTVRGFFLGINAFGGSAIVEDNRVEGSTSIGIQAEAGAIVRRNLVLDTGGTFNGDVIFPITTEGNSEIVGNRVDGTIPAFGSTTGGNGIYAVNVDGLQIRDNTIVGVNGGASPARPLVVQSGVGALISGNLVVGAPSATNGINCLAGTHAVLRGNTVLGFTTEDGDCLDGGGNWFD